MRDYKDGFIILNYSQERKLLVYMDARNISLYDKERSDYIRFYHEENLTGLAFENEVYYPFESVDVLEQYPFIEHLLIGQKNIKDLKGIQHVNCLKGLYLDDNSAVFDFEYLKEDLETLSLTWHRNLANLQNLKNLKLLHIEKDNEHVILPPNIEELELWKSKRTNLDFCESLHSLHTMKLYMNGKLTNLQGLVHLNQNLENLEIEKCKNIEDYTPILKLKKLKTLCIFSYKKEKSEELKELENSLVKKDIFVKIHPKLD